MKNVKIWLTFFKKESNEYVSSYFREEVIKEDKSPEILLLMSHVEKKEFKFKEDFNYYYGDEIEGFLGDKVVLDFEFAANLSINEVFTAKCFTQDTDISIAFCEIIKDVEFLVKSKRYLDKDTLELGIVCILSDNPGGICKMYDHKIYN